MLTNRTNSKKKAIVNNPALDRFLPGLHNANFSVDNINFVFVFKTPPMKNINKTKTMMGGVDVGNRGCDRK